MASPRIRYGLRSGKYQIEGQIPRASASGARLSVHPCGNGSLLPLRSYDVWLDGVLYRGLTAPFAFSPDVIPGVLKAKPSNASRKLDALLSKGGGRNLTPAESFVPADDQIWSIGI